MEAGRRARINQRIDMGNGQHRDSILGGKGGGKGGGMGGGGADDRSDGGDAIAYFTPVVVGSCVLMMVLFSLCGLFGVLAFPGEGREIAGDVLSVLARKGTLGNIARGVLVLACVLSAPLLVHPARSCIDELVTYVCV